MLKLEYKKLLCASLFSFFFVAQADNFVKDGGFESEKSPWILNGRTIDSSEKHTGSSSLKLSEGKKQVLQKISINQSGIQPLEISFWCKSKEVRKKNPKSRSGLIPVAIFQDGKSDYRVDALSFAEGNSDWSKRILHYQPKAPLKDLFLYFTFEDCEGDVWIDDVSVTTLKEQKNSDNLLQNASFAGGRSSWGIWNGFIDFGTGREGSPNSLCFSYPDEKTTGAHAVQKVTLNQKEAAPILFSVWSKTKDLQTKGKSPDYAMSLVVHYQDGKTNWQVPPQRLNFSNHDWEKTEYIYNPPKAVKTADLYLVFRKNPGTVWFDDAVVKELKTEKAVENAPCKIMEAPDESGAKTVLLENSYVKLVVEPAKGGTCKSFIDKRTKASYASVNMDYRMFTDRLREQTRVALFQQSFQTKILNDSSEVVSLEMQLDSMPGFPWVSFSKIITITRNSPIVKITYQYHNKQASMAPVVVSPYFRSGVSVYNEPTTFFYPLSKEIKKDLNTAGGGPVYKDAVRGWIGGLAKDGKGIACEYDFSRLEGITAWYGGLNESTLEWWFSSVNIKNGETFSTDVFWLPLNGMPSVDNVENGIAGSFISKDGKYGYTLVSGKSIACSIVAEAKYKDSKTVVREHSIALSPEKNCTVFFDFPNQDSIQHISYKLLQNGKTFFSSEKPFVEGYRYLPQTAKVSPAEVKPFTLTLSQKVKTPHIPWCNPYYKGKTKVLGLIDVRYGRELVELAQRMDIKLNTGRLSTNETVLGQNMAERYLQFNQNDANVSLAALLKEKYDVIIVCGGLWKTFNAENIKSIRKMLESGTGLVLIQPSDVPASILPFTPLSNSKVKARRAFSGASVTGSRASDSAMSFAAWEDGVVCDYDFSPNAAVLVKAGKHPFLVKGGKNSSVICYETTGTLLPFLSYKVKFPDYNYIEAQFPFLIRTILEAAGKAPETELRNLAVQGKRLNFTLTGNLPGKNLTARIFVESILTAEKKEITVKLNPAGENHSLELPMEPAAGKNLVSIVLLADGKVFNWGNICHQKQPTVRIGSLTADSEPLYEAGSIVRGKLSVTGKATRIDIELQDAWKRIIARKTVVPGDFNIKIPEASSKRMFLQAKVFDGNILQDKQEVSLQIDLPRREADYTLSVGDNHMADGRNRFIQEEYYRIIQELGVDTLRFWVPDRYWAFDDYLRLNFGFIFNVISGKLRGNFRKDFVVPYQKTLDKKYLCRKDCLHDEDSVGPRFLKEEEFLSKQKKYSPVCVDFGDENSLTLWSGRFDFCFSPKTLTAFRTWLKEQYATLDALNLEWGSNFTAWENVMPSTTAEIQKSAKGNRNYAAWADHRRFMDLSYANYFGRANQIAKKVNGKLVNDLSGISAPNAYSGLDWWLFSKFMDRASFYREGRNDDIVTSFNGVRSTAWYGYGATGDHIKYDLWNDAFRSQKSGGSFFSGGNILNPDFTVPKATSDFFDAAKDLRLGIGRLLESLEAASPDVLVHYSMSSIRTHDLEGRMSEYLDSRTTWQEIMNDLKLRPRLISYEEIEQGKLTASGAKIFVMPLSISISAKEAEEIRKFVSQGGILLADRMVGIMNEHSRKLSKGLLDDVFGLERPDDQTKGVTEFSYKGVDFKLAVGSAANKEANHKAIFVNRYGKGNALFLNALLNGYSSLRRSVNTRKDAEKYLELLKGFCGDVLDKRIIKVSTGDIDIPHTKNFLYQRNAGSEKAYFVGLLREEGNGKEVKINIASEKSSHVYSVRDGKYLGFLKEINLPLLPAEAKLLALMPYRIENVELLAPKICKQGDIFELSVNIIGKGEKIDHPVRLDFFQPDGKLSYFYSKNITAEKGRWNMKIRTALNEMPGNWKIVAKDIVSGKTQTVTLKIEK